MVIQNLMENVATSKNLLKTLVPKLQGQRDCPCGAALQDAIITPREGIPDEVKRKLAPLVGQYLT